MALQLLVVAIFGIFALITNRCAYLSLLHTIGLILYFSPDHLKVFGYLALFNTVLLQCIQFINFWLVFLFVCSIQLSCFGRLEFMYGMWTVYDFCETYRLTNPFRDCSQFIGCLVGKSSKNLFGRVNLNCCRWGPTVTAIMAPPIVTRFAMNMSTTCDSLLLSSSRCSLWKHSLLTSVINAWLAKVVTRKLRLISRI